MNACSLLLRTPNNLLSLVQKLQRWDLLDSKKPGPLHFYSLSEMQTKETRASSCLLKFRGLALDYSKAWRNFECFCVYISPALLSGNCTLSYLLLIIKKDWLAVLLISFHSNISWNKINDWALIRITKVRNVEECNPGKVLRWWGVTDLA